MRTIRFWYFHKEGWVKLSLQDGAKLEHFWGERRDEGWSSEAHEWTRHRNVITERVAHDGTDCDGRLQQFAEYSLSLRDLKREKSNALLARLAGFKADKYANPDGYRTPWKRVSSSQRDHFAEAMGY